MMPALEDLADLLACPKTARPLTYRPDGFVVVGGEADGQRYEIAEGLVWFVPRDDPRLGAHGERFLAPRDEEHVLRPSQLRFRRLLRAFLAEQPHGAAIADVGCADAEFAPMFANHRYVPLDLSVPRLRLALSLGRIRYGLVTDVNALPLREAAFDAVVCTNTLQHLPIETIPAVASGLLRRVRPGGAAGLTMPTRAAQALRRHLPQGFRIEEVRPLTDAREDRFAFPAVGVVNHALARAPESLRGVGARAFNRVLSRAERSTARWMREAPQRESTVWLSVKRDGGGSC